MDVGLSRQAITSAPNRHGFRQYGQGYNIGLCHTRVEEQPHVGPYHSDILIILLSQ
jgi:hypothetical protein